MISTWAPLILQGLPYYALNDKEFLRKDVATDHIEISWKKELKKDH